MSGLFGGGMVNETPRINVLRIQTSSYGVAIPVVLGRQRCTGNLLYYGDLKAIRHEEEVGGKGGGGVTNVWYTYRYSIQIGICEGPVGVDAIWMQSGDKKTRLDQSVAYGYTIYSGSTPNGYNATLANRHPTEFFHYPGLANLTAVDMGEFEGDAPPQFSFEVRGYDFDYIIGGADPARAIHRIITDTRWGAAAPSDSFPVAWDYGDYAVAMGWQIGLEMAAQKPAADWIGEILEQTNSAPVWAADRLEIVPWGDTAVSGNYRSWAPSVAPAYDLTDDHFLGDPAEPVRVNRRADSEAYNIQAVEYRNPANEYNIEAVDADDAASVAMFGPKKSTDVLKAHGLGSATAALRLGAIRVQRQQQRRNEYEFTLPWTFCRLLPMDIVTLSDALLGMQRHPVRLTRVVENENLEIECTAEDYIAGAGHAALIETQGASGYSKDFNTPPGASVAPVMFEPPIALAGQPEIWLGTSGGDQWGGCNIWISTDDISYKLAGRTTGKARMGVTVSAIAAIGDPDPVSQLGVNLAISGAALLGCTEAERDTWATLSMVGGELIGYQDATLTGPNTYTLAKLRRGAYGSPIAAHLAGSPYLRLDGAVFRHPYSPDQIGKTLYVKLQSFNLFGGGVEEIETLSPHIYTIAGAPMGSVANLALEQPWTGLSCQIKWDAYPGAISYRVEVWTAGALRRTVTNPATRYSYSYEDMRADGGPWRTLEFRVSAISANGQSAAPAILPATNPQAAAPNNLQVTAGTQSVSMSVNIPAATDYRGTRFHLSTTAGFAPAPENLVYDGPDTSYSMMGLEPGETVYIVAAHYDAYGDDGLNYCAQASATPVVVDAGVEIVSALPTTGNTEGRVVFLNADGKLYRYHLGAWTSAVSAADIAGQIVNGQLAANSVTTDQLVSGSVTAAKIGVSALAAISADLGTITAGNMTLDASGFIRGGATGYLSGPGFWMGYSGGAHKFHLGNPGGNHLYWDGSQLSIKANLNAATGTIGILDIASGGALRQGQTDWATGTGFWLGDKAGVPKFSVGNNANYIKWDGSALLVGGKIIASDNLLDDAVSNRVVAYDAGTITGQTAQSTTVRWTTIQTAQIVCAAGEQVMITFSGGVGGGNAGLIPRLRVKRGSNIIYGTTGSSTGDAPSTVLYGVNSSTGGHFCTSFTFVDTPGDGTHVYTVDFGTHNTSVAPTAAFRMLYLLKIKK